MLTKLKLSNFRRFQDHEVPLNELTVLVGPNNAGKSTIVEAMRLVALVANRLRGLHFERTPSWLEAPAGPWCLVPSLRGMDFELDDYAFHRLQGPPAVIAATFARGGQICVYVGPDGEVCAVVRDRKGESLSGRRQLGDLGLDRIGIQPQVAPLERVELLRDEKYVRSAVDSTLAPRHFRNQVYYLHQYFDEFQRIAEETWPGLAVSPVEFLDDRLQMMVRTEDFTGEVAQMGHGLQMWLQLMWFLARAEEERTVILDEPDVYMHADLRRRLVKFLRNRHPQIVIATHATEIMSEVEPNEIVVVNARKRRSKPAADRAAVQEVIDDLGVGQNLQVARLWHARRCLFVEGNDGDLLRRLHSTLYPASSAFDSSPVFPIDGWSGWQHVPKLAEFVRQTVGDDVVQFCVLDSDYHWPDELQKRAGEARAIGVELIIWPRKELENYLLVPAAMQRLIARSAPSPPAVDAVESRLQRVAKGLRKTVLKGFVDSYEDRLGRHVAGSTAMTKAEKHVQGRWGQDGPLALVPGKEGALRGMSRWSQKEFGVGLSAFALASEIQHREMAPEVERFLRAFELVEPL